VTSDQLRKDDVVVVEAGELIPGDGEIIEGAATVDESAITGESAPVVREAGGDRSAVTGRHARAVGRGQDPHYVESRARRSWTG
jgi:P-type E1-E2 ATPase